MIVKALLALALASASVPVAPATAPVITYDEQRLGLQYPLVSQVICDKGKGTAFRIGGNRFLSVAHVTIHSGCAIDGHPIKVIENDTKLDFSIIEAGPKRIGGFKINCGGFQTSQWYWSNGFALGLSYQTTVALYSTAYDDNTGKRIFIGRHMVIPGMSGGPVLNPAGEVVGLVNAYHPLFGLSFSRALKDTSVCKS
jgi:hypothetical protein